jgi:hypothetical protein
MPQQRLERGLRRRPVPRIDMHPRALAKVFFHRGPISLIHISSLTQRREAEWWNVPAAGCGDHPTWT